MSLTPDRIMNRAGIFVPLYRTMKKPFFLVLAFLYIASSCEASVYLHYCMGKQVSFSFSPEKSGSCHRCGMKKSGGMGCCKDEQKIIKSDKSQKVTDLVSSDTHQKRYVIFPVVYNIYLVNICQPSTDTHYPVHGPPEIKAFVPLFLMNRVFLI
jgi:hypothetical protein